MAYEDIKNSNIFFIIGTDYYFNSFYCYLETQMAKSLKKPFRVALKEGTKIPEDYFDGIEDLKIKEYKDSKALLECFNLLCKPVLKLNPKLTP